MKTITDIIMDSLEERIKEISAAAWKLVEQVEKYTFAAGCRSQLLDAKEQLKKVLRE